MGKKFLQSWKAFFSRLFWSHDKILGKKSPCPGVFSFQIFVSKMPKFDEFFGSTSRAEKKISPVKNPGQEFRTLPTYDRRIEVGIWRVKSVGRAEKHTCLL